MRHYILALGLIALSSTSNALPESNSLPAVSFMRPWEARKLTAPQKLNYFRALHTFMTSLETGTPGEKGAPRNVLRELALPNAFAAPSVGEECVIGGYASNWYRRPDGHLSCAAPQPDAMIKSTTDTSFFCGKGESARTAYCNSAVYLYNDTNGERFCRSIDNFSSNCQKAFESRYGNSPGGDPKFPERLTKDYDQLSRSASPEELEAYYAKLDTLANKLVKEGSFDRKSAESMRNQINIINKTRTVGSAAVDGVTAPAPAAPTTSGGTAALAPSASNNVTVNAGGAAAPAKVTVPGPGGTLAPAAPTEAPVTDEQAAAAPPSAVDPEKADQPPAAPAGEESKILGRELSCVRDGLKSLGYSPSERFLSLLGTGIQASGNAYDTNQEVSRKTFQSRVISMVQAYGFCDEKSYPSKKWKSHETQLARRWLNADGGKAKPQTGVPYLAQMTDPASVAGRRFSEMYGLSADDGLKPFARDEKSWDAETLADRQSHFHGWKPRNKKGDFDRCRSDARKRREQDRRFRLQALRMPPPGPDGKRPALADAVKTDMQKIQKDSQTLCETMARACGVNTAKTCGGELAPAPTSQPPAAPPGQPPAPVAPAASAPARQ